MVICLDQCANDFLIGPAEMTYNVFSGTLNPTHFTSPPAGATATPSSLASLKSRLV